MEVLSDESRYWSDDIKEKWALAPYWSTDKWIDVKRWWTEEKVSILFETNLSRKTPVPSSHSGKAYSGNARINPALQDNVLLPKDFTKYIQHVGNGKELRSMVHHGLVPGGFSTKTGR